MSRQKTDMIPVVNIIGKASIGSVNKGGCSGGAGGGWEWVSETVSKGSKQIPLRKLLGS